MAALPPLCPWRLDIVRAVLRGTRDDKSPMRLLSSEVLKMIIRRWAWPEVFVNSVRLWEPDVFLDVLIGEMLECNSGAVDSKGESLTEATLRRWLQQNPDKTIKKWDLRDCGLRALPELFGALHTTEDLILSDNQLISLPASFGHLSVGKDLWLNYNQLTELPASFGHLSVGKDLWLNHNQLTELPASFGLITVGEHLRLHDNPLTELPDSFLRIDLVRCCLNEKIQKMARELLLVQANNSL